jgi:glycogen synthase
MTPKTTLLLAPALAPLTGDDPQACAVRDLARALQQTGWHVTVVLGVDKSVDTNRVGLARRLEPLTLGDEEFIVHEGSIESGDIRLLAIGADQEPKPIACLEAAMTLMEAPSVLQLWARTRSALPAAESLQTADGSTAVVVHLAPGGTSTEAMRAELAQADLLLLSSKTALKEQTSKKNSLWGDLTGKLQGLPPGFDDREWNPARDGMLARRMDPPDLATKTEAKEALRAELGLKDEDVPLIGVVTEFKSIPREMAAELLKLPVQFAGIDAGSQLESMASRSPRQAACPKPVSDYERKQLRHRIVAAADFVLMPAAPTPLSQLYPCRYGTAVIAPKKGEFAERLANFDSRTRTGCGFLYREDHELINTIRHAIAVWGEGEETRAALIERCLNLDLSWDTVALRLTELLSPAPQ